MLALFQQALIAYIKLRMLSDSSAEAKLLSSPGSHKEPHVVTGSLIKSIVYGGIDGVINTTVILLTGYSSNAPVDKLFALVFSATVVGALDMALCDYVSSKSEMSFVLKEQSRQMYQVQNMLEEEMNEMKTIYCEKGYSQPQATRLVELMSTNKQAFTNIMMMEELGLVKTEDQNMPIKCGLATFVIFLTTGMITMSPYIYTYWINQSKEHPWPYVLGISGLMLLSLGLAKGKIVGLNPWKQALQFVLLGATGTTIGFFIGKVFQTS